MPLTVDGKMQTYPPATFEPIPDVYIVKFVNGHPVLIKNPNYGDAVFPQGTYCYYPRDPGRRIIISGWPNITLDSRYRCFLAKITGTIGGWLEVTTGCQFPGIPLAQVNPAGLCRN